MGNYLISGCLGDEFGKVGGEQGTYNTLNIAVLRSWLITTDCACVVCPCVCVCGGGGGGEGARIALVALASKH